MAYDTLRKRYNREPFTYVEIEVDATTYRFSENRSPLPNGFDGQPTLLSVNMSPARINLEGGFGLRASASISISESMTYTEFSASISSPRRFWACWRAANPYYKNQRMSIFSGYIENNTYDVTNFIRRDYIIDTFAWTADGVQISLKDPLKLASNSSAKLPVESRGYLASDITDTDTTATLAPSGIGDSKYPAASSGDSATWYQVRINDEVITVTNRSGDTLTITRAEYNTVASAHGADDTVQVCLTFTDETVSDIAYHLLVTGAGIDSSYINKVAWDAESSANFPNTYSAIITEPTGINDLAEEFSQSAPHYLYYDERVNLIQFVALKPPVTGGNILTYEGNLLRGRTVAGDDQNARVSTVVFYFGIFNPVKDLDETSNYRQVYIREDSDSVTNYGSRAYKVIYSRWVSNDSKTAAVLACSRYGRRFASAPRTISYELDPKDSDSWTGDNVSIQTDLILNDTTFDPATIQYQILSAREDFGKKVFKYDALEHTYGPPVDGDDDVEDPNVRLIYIAGEQDQLKDDGGTPRSLRDLYDDEYPGDIDAAYDVRFIVEPSAVLGSSSNSAYAISTGSFPELTTPPLLDVRGLVVGKGGDGADVFGTAEDGGPAILLENDIRLDNSGIIGGGGGGGYYFSGTGTDTADAAGGGGAGFTNGVRGNGTFADGIRAFFTLAENGTNTTGGQGGYAINDSSPEPNFASGGAGGDLGDAGGGASGGAAGDAINTNGYTITYLETGTILGAII